MSATVYFVAASPSPLSAASSVKHCYRNLGKPPPPIGFQVQGVISVSLTPERTFRGGRDDKTAKNTTINRGEGEDAGSGDAPLGQELLQQSWQPPRLSVLRSLES